jgi:hypothetical protein
VLYRIAVAIFVLTIVATGVRDKTF